MIISFLLVILASFFLGTFGLGMKYSKPLPWEGFWAIHAITGMLIIPMIWGLIVVPDLFQSIFTAPSDAIIRGFILGFIWGIGGVMFGISVTYVGVSLTYGVVMGTTGAIGGLVPLFQMAGFASQRSFPVIIIGVLIMMTGVAIIAYAGMKREKAVSESGVEIEGIKAGKEFRKGIVIVSISGVLSSFINIGFANALPVANNAVLMGATPVNSSLAAWVVVLWGAIAFNLLYSVFLLTKNKTWKGYALPKIGSAVKWAVVAALFWFGALGVYGLGAAKMGPLGTVIGWPVFVGLSLIFSNIWAIRAGEWKGIIKPKKLMFLGIAILIFATVILAFANLMDQKPDYQASKGLEVVAVLNDENAFNRTHDIEVQNGIAYLAGKGGSLTIVNVKDPVKPGLLWYLHDKDKYDEAETVMPLSHDRLLIGTRDVLLFDITDPANPLLLDKIEDRVPVNLINGFARRNNIVFGANKNGYIFAVDVSDSDKLQLTGFRETNKSGELESPHDVVFCRELLVVVSPQGFRDRPGKLAVYRVFDPATDNLLPSSQWQLLGLIEHTKLAGANRVESEGSLACVGSSNSFNAGGETKIGSNTSVVDLSDPAKPVLRGSIDFPDVRGPNGLELKGNTAYAAGGQTVQAIDLSNPDKLTQLASVKSVEAFPGSKDDGHDLVLAGDHLFVTAQNSHSLVVIAVSPEIVYKKK